MTSVDYAVWIEKDELFEEIYDGKNKSEVINAITNFVNESSNANLVSKESILNLDEEALAKVGIYLIKIKKKYSLGIVVGMMVVLMGALFMLFGN